jgi:serine/threonine protein kinase
MFRASQGLSALHAQNVVHMDVSPGNILFSREVVGQQTKIRALLSDFGHCHHKTREDYDESRVGTHIRGTYPFISPEYIRDADMYTPMPSNDMFAFGLVFLQALFPNEKCEEAFDSLAVPKSLNEVHANRVLHADQWIHIWTNLNAHYGESSLREKMVDFCYEFRLCVQGGHLKRTLIDLILECLQVDPLKRPNSSEVASELEQMIILSKSNTNLRNSLRQELTESGKCAACLQPCLRHSTVRFSS